MRTRVKICCISSCEEAALAVCCGADALGLVSAMPSGPGVIGDDLIREIAATVPPGVASFLLTSRREADAIVEQVRHAGVNTVQICDSVPMIAYTQLRRDLPGVGIVQVIHVAGEPSIDEAREVAEHVDAILLDSGSRCLPVKELGGTGRRHDWGISRRIVEAVPCPVYLAGGIRPENVGDAVRQVRPFGIDLCTGVRTDDRLDENKLTALFARLTEAAVPAG